MGQAIDILRTVMSVPTAHKAIAYSTQGLRDVLEEVNVLETTQATALESAKAFAHQFEVDKEAMAQQLRCIGELRDENQAQRVQNVCLREQIRHLQGVVAFLRGPSRREKMLEGANDAQIAENNRLRAEIQRLRAAAPGVVLASGGRVTVKDGAVTIEGASVEIRGEIEVTA